MTNKWRSQLKRAGFMNSSSMRDGGRTTPVIGARVTRSVLEPRVLEFWCAVSHTHQDALLTLAPSVLYYTDEHAGFWTYLSVFIDSRARSFDLDPEIMQFTREDRFINLSMLLRAFSLPLFSHRINDVRYSSCKFIALRCYLNNSFWWNLFLRQVA